MLGGYYTYMHTQNSFIRKVRETSHREESYDLFGKAFYLQVCPEQCRAWGCNLSCPEQPQEDGGRGAASLGSDGGRQVPSCQLGDSLEVQSVPLHVYRNFKINFSLRKEGATAQ